MTTTSDLSDISVLINNNTASLKEMLKELKTSQGELSIGVGELAQALKSFSLTLLEQQKVLKESQVSIVALIDATGKAHDLAQVKLGQIENVQQAYSQRMDSGFQGNTAKLEQLHQALVDDRAKINELLKRTPEVKVEEKGWKHYTLQGLKVVGIALGGAGTVLAYQYAFGSEPQQPQLQLSTQ